MRSQDPAILVEPRHAAALGGAGISQDARQAACFESLVREHQASIFRVAYRLTGDRDEAEDLVQEALVEAFEAFHRYRSGSFFDRWLFRIMRNTFLDSKRRTSKTTFQSIDTSKPESRKTRDLGVSPFAADTELMARTLDGPIQEALDALPADFRLVVVLADIEGLSYEEVSEIVGRPIGTVRSRLHRGRMVLKEKLKSYVRS
jgi:RNA polymerase sigma-70 factor, ECF subfamily